MERWRFPPGGQTFLRPRRQVSILQLRDCRRIFVRCLLVWIMVSVKGKRERELFGDAGSESQPFTPPASPRRYAVVCPPSLPAVERVQARGTNSPQWRYRTKSKICTSTMLHAYADCSSVCVSRVRESFPRDLEGASGPPRYLLFCCVYPRACV